MLIAKDLMHSQPDFYRKVVQCFEENNIPIEHMPSGIDTMSIFVHREEFEEHEQNVIAGIYRAVQPDLIDLESDLALIAVVGRGMRFTRGTSGRIFSALSHANVNVRIDLLRKYIELEEQKKQEKINRILRLSQQHGINVENLGNLKLLGLNFHIYKFEH